MNFKKTIFALAIGSVGIMGAMGAQAAALNNGDVLTITAGTGTSITSKYGGVVVTGTGGSYFTMVGVGAGLLSQGSAGIVIGQTQAVGAIDAPWTFSGALGQDYTKSAITGSTTSGLNMSGWNVTWNGIAAIPMGGGAWGTGYSNGVGNFTWDGVYGDAYTLTYRGTVPAGDPSGFGTIKYALNMKGTVMAGQVSPVPEASTYSMMAAGLGLLGFLASRRKAS